MRDQFIFSVVIEVYGKASWLNPYIDNIFGAVEKFDLN